MTDEQFPLVVTRYRDKAGNPTCAADFNAGMVCEFYCTQKFGCSETCLFANREFRYWQEINRRDGGAGSLIPLACCPLWNGENEMRHNAEASGGLNPFDYRAGY